MRRMVIMRGVSYSGKSTWIKENLMGFDGWTEDAIICPDNIRIMLTGDISNQTANKEVFEIAHRIAECRCDLGRDVIWDATNTRLRDIKAVADHARRRGIRVMIIDLTIPPNDVLAHRSAERAAQGRPLIPDEVLKRQREHYTNGTPFILKWVKETAGETTPKVGITIIDPVSGDICDDQ